MRKRLRYLVFLCAVLVSIFLLLQLAALQKQSDTETAENADLSVDIETAENPHLVLPKHNGQQVAENEQAQSGNADTSTFRVHYKFAFMLETMGYSAPRPRSAKAKAELDQFFGTVQHFAITKRERAVFVDLWQSFDLLCREQNFTYFLFFGSLLGAYRHHAMVPWDDDLDLLLPESDMGPLIVLLKDHAELESAEQSFFVHRVFFRDRRKSLPRYGEPWSWPYLELHFYRLSEGGRIKQGFNSCPAAKETHFFPLVHVPFEGHMAPAPRCMDKIVTECYGDVSARCCTKNYDHRRGEDLHRSACIACHHLIEAFPFVTRRKRLAAAAFEETVTLNGSVLAVRSVTKGRRCLGQTQDV